MSNITEKTLPGNYAIILDNSEPAKIIKSGTIGIFLTKIKDRKPIGKRHYLFTLKKGDAIFCTPPHFDSFLESEIGIIGLTFKETVLQEITVNQLIDYETELNRLLENWLDHFQKKFKISLESKSSHTKQLQKLPEFYQKLYQQFSNYLHQENIDRAINFQTTQEINSELTTTALAELTSVFQTKTDASQINQIFLLMAAGAVGKAIGITLIAPSSKPDQEITLEDIAIASKVRIRSILLSGEWWLKDQGNFLGFTQENNTPVALIIDKNNGFRYFLYDPKKNRKIIVSEAIANTIISEAYIFYRPLPFDLQKATSVFNFAIKDYNQELINLFIIGFIGTFLGLAIPQATAILINQAIPDSNKFLLLQIGIALLIVSFGKAILNLSQGFISLRIINGVASFLQPTIWDRLLQLSPAFIRKFSNGDLLTRIMVISQIYVTLSGSTQRIILNSIFSLLNLGLMLFYSIKLTIIALIIALIAVIFTWISGSILLKQQRQQEELSGQIQGLTIQLINGVAKLKVAAAEERAFATWAKKYGQYNRINQKIIVIKNILIIFNNSLLLIASILLYWFGFSRLSQANSSLNLGTFLAFNAAFGTFFQGLTSGSEILLELLNLIPLWERVQPILKETIESDTNKVIPSQLLGQVIVSHINFRYRVDSPLILDDISLYANAGEFIAIVGPSGSGKSTLFRLLLGFESPVSGVIYYDGQDLAILDRPALRRQLGVVLQNGKVIQGSIFENITSGTNRSMDDAWEASDLAQFTQEIESMPMGMHTVVSEGGSNLSGGQKQRLMIARSLVFNPKVLLFDEATSALDNHTQAMITDSLEQLEVTRIVIAHRLSTIRNADRIYVMESGKIVQEGGFDQLLNQPGLFAKLAARQLS
jgi:NHLM bacteriocin system ABC transporter ATP-binding protein